MYAKFLGLRGPLVGPYPESADSNYSLTHVLLQTSDFYSLLPGVFLQLHLYRRGVYGHLRLKAVAGGSGGS